jgi:hypothetical protein
MIHTIDLDAVLARPLSPRERQIVTLRYVKRLRNPEIAERLGITIGCVTSTLWNARRRSGERLKPTVVKKYPGDEWFARNVALARTMEPEKQARFLNGFEIVWGEVLRAKLEQSL